MARTHAHALRRWAAVALLGFVLAWSLCGTSLAATAKSTMAPLQSAQPSALTLGVLAAGPQSKMTLVALEPLLAQWRAALPGHEIQAVVLDWDRLEQAVEQRQVDFVLTNPLQWVELRHRQQVSAALATRVMLEAGVAVHARGAVAIRQAGRMDLAHPTALGRGRKTVAVAATAAQGMFSYMAPLVELREAGIPTSGVRWLEMGARQEAIVEAVRSGQADMGWVRTGLLEELQQQGRVQPGEFVVVPLTAGSITGSSTTAPSYPVEVSTRLYPEWPLAALPHVPTAWVQRLTATALLYTPLTPPTPPDPPGWGQWMGFTVPADYSVVEQGMRRVRMAPFDEVPPFTLQDVWARYQSTLMLGLGATLVVLLSLLLLVRTQHQRTQVLRNMSDGFVRVDRRWRYTMLNKQATHLLDLPEHLLLGEVMWEVFPKDVGDVFETLYRQAMDSGQATRLEVHVPPWNRWFENRLIPDRWGMSIFFTDITERKLQEIRLHESEQHFRHVANGGDALIWTSDLYGVCNYFNEPWLRFTGRTLAQEKGQGWMESVHPDDIAHVRREFDQARSLRVPFSLEYRLRRADGAYRWIRDHGSPRRNSDDRWVGYIGFCSDITEERATQEALQRSEERHRAIVQALPDLLFHIDADGRILDFQTAHTRDLFLAPAAFLGQRITEIMPRQVAEPAMHAIDLTLKGTGTTVMEYRLPMRQGLNDYEMRIVRLRDNEVLAIARNITERVQAREAQRLSAIMFDSSHDGIMITDASLHLLQVNPAFTRITGYALSDVQGQRPTLMAPTGQRNMSFYRQLWTALRRHGAWQGEVWSRRKSGEVFMEMLCIRAVHDKAGHISHHVGVFSDISERKAHEAELNRLAFYDPLTGTPNRRLLIDRLQSAVAQARLHQRPLAVCYLDLDDFKTVNEQLGAHLGDRLLVMVAQRLQQAIDSQDTLARLGGDEFVVLLTQLGHPHECEAHLERLLHTVRAPMTLDAQVSPLGVSVSIGVALFPADDADPDTLLRHADQAMYRAKELGRNRIHFFNADNDRDSRHRRDHVARLHQALSRNEFVLYYQPKVDLQTHAVVGVEALIRWQHPEQGLLPPGLFLHQDLEGELDVAIGEWVIDTAMAQHLQWQAAGLLLPVSVNISGHQLLQADFVQRLQALQQRHAPLAAGMLEMEILESATVSDLERAAEVMRQCELMGIHFALDDFGTGYSSLSLFRRLPVQTVKIDQSFVRDMLVSANDRGIVETVIHLANAFQRSAVAEGVETQALADALRELGCGIAQGYGIAHPMPASQIPTWCQVHLSNAFPSQPRPNASSNTASAPCI